MTKWEDSIKKFTQIKQIIYLLKELEKLKTFHSIYLKGKCHFEDVTQYYLVFQRMYRYFKRVAGADIGNYIYFRKSKGLCDENITAPTASNYNLNPQLSYLGNKKGVEFKGSCLKQDKITYDSEKVVNIYIVYEISKNYDISNYPLLENCLPGAVAQTNKYR